MPRFREVRRGEAKLGLQPKRMFASPSLSPTLSPTIGLLGRAQPWKCGGKWSGRGLIESLFFFLIFNNLRYADAAAAAAKSLQSCPILCNPIDSSPPGSPVPGILQARTLEWVAISFSNA